MNISSTTSGSSIHYTLDGTQPTASCPPYTGSISIGTTTTLTAAAFKSGWTTSDARVATYTMNFGTLGVPTMTPAAGTYTQPVSVTLAAQTGATIRYTTNGTSPTTSSPIYTSPVAVASTTTLKAKAFKTDYTPSADATGTYTLLVTAPTMSPTPGTFATAQTVSLSTSTQSATIRYTTNGSTPTSTSTLYTAPFSVATTSTVKAIAFRTGWADSAVTTGVYTMNFGTLTVPTINPASGTFNGPQTVMLSAQTGATIRYTIDGSTPTASSTAYSGPISISTTTTSKRRRFASTTQQAPKRQARIRSPWRRHRLHRTVARLPRRSR